MERLAFNAGPTAPAAATAAAPSIEVEEHDRSDARFERLDSYAFKGLLAFIFVLFVRPQDELPFLEPLHLADLTAAFSLMSLIGGRLGRGASITRTPRELTLILAFGAVMLATSPFSTWPGGSIAVFTDLFSKVIVVFALMVNTVTTRRRLDLLISIVVLGTSYIAVRTCFDYFRGVNLVEGERASGGVGGLFGNPNDLAMNMVAFLPLAIVVALGRGRRLLRLAALVGAPFIAMAIIASKSRGGMVGVVAMVLVLLYHMRRVRPGIAALVVAGTLATIPMLPQAFTDRMASIFNPEEDPTGSREARKQLLREAYQAFLDNPLFGVGAGQFQNYKPDQRTHAEAWREAHSAVLQVASELGVGGIVIFAMIVWSGFASARHASALLRRARRRRRRTHGPPLSRAERESLQLYATGLIASLSGWLVAAMFASVAYYWTLYLVLGLAVALKDIAQRTVNPPVVAGPVQTPGIKAA
jgi:O-antigen ligase